MSYAEPRNPATRLTALAAVAVFHVVLIYALMHGLARQIVEVVRPPLETKIIEDVRRPPLDTPPPPPPPKLATPPPPFIPPPEVRVQVPVQPAPTITAVVPTPPPAPIPPPAAPRAVVGTPARANCEKPPYPSASRRAGEIGVVRMSLLIGADGRILENKLARSSGYKRLDEAAREGLRECKPKPAIVDGKPERSWVTVDFIFSLTD
jgi:protein TonB